MKTKIQLLFVLFVSALWYPALAQDAKIISVFGGAEKIVEADEIIVSITLQEYDGDAGKVNMAKLEGDMLKAAREVNIPANAILVENLNGYNNFGGYDGAPSFMLSKTYQVRVNNLDALNKLLAKIGNQGLASANVTYFNNSKAKEHMNELKTKALQNAKEEADILAKAVGKKLGDVVGIEVFQDYTTMYNYDSYAPYYGPLQTGARTGVGVKPVALRFSVKVSYALQ